MNLFEYVTRMEETRSPMAYVGVVLLALVIIYITVKMLLGMKRGMWRQLVSTGCTLTAAVIAYVFSSNLASAIVNKLDAKTFEGLIPYIEQVLPGSGETIKEFFGALGSDFLSNLFAIPTALVLVPFLMVVIFIVLHLLLKLIKAIVVAILRLKKPDGSPSRLGGALLAAMEAVIVLVMVLLPLSGIFGIVDTAYTDAMEQAKAEDRQEMEEVYDEIISPLTNNPIIGFTNTFGAKRMYKNISTVRIGENRVDVSEEVVDISHIIVTDLPTLLDANYMELSEEDKAAIDSVIEVVCESEYLSNILVKLLNGTATAIEKGVIKFNIGGAYKPLFNDVLAFLESVSIESLDSDIDSVKKIYYTVSDSGILEAAKNGGDIMELLQERRREGDDTVKIIVEILKSNNRMSNMVTSMTEALISTLSTNIELGDDVTITYDELKSDMNNVLSVKKDNYDSDEEYMEALSGTLDDTLRNHGIELEKDIVDSIAEYVDKEYSETEEFTDEEFNDVLLHYYDAYLNYLDSGELPEDIIGGGDENGETPPIGNKVGNLCPGYSLELIDGSGTVNPCDYSGKIVIINFWGTWCGPCKTELPHFDRVAEEYEGEVVVITIHSTAGKDAAPSYISNNYSDSRMIFAYDIALMQNVDMYYNLLGGKSSYPRTMILDENGVITFIQDGALGYDDLVREINAIKNK